jgi:integrase
LGQFSSISARLRKRSPKVYVRAARTPTRRQNCASRDLRIAQLRLFLDRHRTRSGNPAGGFIFRNPLGNPLNLDALVRKVIRPALGAAKIPWYGWHAFRRGLATNLHRLGVSDKVIQQILRHANVTTTMNIYGKLVSRDAEEAMKTLETKCAAVVLQPRLENAPVEANAAMVTVQKTLPLEAVRGILAERGGLKPPLVSGR